MEQNDLQRALMAVLFAAGEPIDARRLSQTLERDEAEIHEACKALMDDLSFNRSGIRIVRLENAYQMCSSPEMAEYVTKTLETRKPPKLSPSQLETLTVVAYYQPATKALVEQMRQEFGYVVIDTPPLSAFVDSAVISQNADGTLLVVRRDFAKRDEVLASYDQLKKADANVLGTVLNFCENEKSEYYYSYYNKDGKRVRKSSGSSQSAPKMPDAPLSQRAVRPDNRP